MLFYDKDTKAFQGILQVSSPPQKDHTDINGVRHEVSMKPIITLQPPKPLTDTNLYTAIENTLFMRQARFVISKSDENVFDIVSPTLHEI